MVIDENYDSKEKNCVDVNAVTSKTNNLIKC